MTVGTWRDRGTRGLTEAENVCSDSQSEPELITIVTTRTTIGWSPEVFSNQEAAGKQCPQRREDRSRGWGCRQVYQPKEFQRMWGEGLGWRRAAGSQIRGEETQNPAPTAPLLGSLQSRKSDSLSHGSKHAIKRPRLLTNWTLVQMKLNPMQLPNEVP